MKIIIVKGRYYTAISPFLFCALHGRKEGNMVQVTFKYKDDYSRGKWNTQTCIVESVAQAIEIYGLGIDCEYEIVSVISV